MHHYTLASSYPVELSVTDNDGGTDSESAVVKVVTPEQAVEAIIDLLDGLIASTMDTNVRKDLEKARKALVGNPNGENGALTRSATVKTRRPSPSCKRPSSG